MSVVEVDPDEIHRVASLLRGCGPGVEEVAGAVSRALTLVGEAAGGTVTVAALGAARVWGLSMSSRASAAEALAQSTDAAARAYELVEAAARGRFTRTPVPAP